MLWLFWEWDLFHTHKKLSFIRFTHIFKFISIYCTITIHFCCLRLSLFICLLSNFSLWNLIASDHRRFIWDARRVILFFLCVKVKKVHSSFCSYISGSNRSRTSLTPITRDTYSSVPSVVFFSYSTHSYNELSMIQSCNCITIWTPLMLLKKQS